MQAWRRAYAVDAARFICVSVDGRPKETAREFQRLYFDDTMTNAFIDHPEDFPRFPAQLGCQGLIVLDANGRFATQRSPAYLDYRGQAFRAVEDMLAPLVAAAGEQRGRAPKDEDDDVAASEAKPNAPGAVFSENACCDAPTPLDDDREPRYALPPIGHEGVDADHAVITDLMRAAAASHAASDLAALRDEFLAHASREEAIVRDAEARARAAGAGAEGVSRFEASDSHAADHARIVGLARDAMLGAGGDGRVPAAAVQGVCRAILEHAATFDTLAARTLAAAV